MSHVVHACPYSTFGGLWLGAMSKTDGIADQTDTISVLWKGGGRGWKSLYFTCPGSSILIPFDCGGTPGCKHDLSCVAACAIYDRNTFLNRASSWVRICADSCVAETVPRCWLGCNKWGLDPSGLALVGWPTHLNLLQLQMQCQKHVTTTRHYVW